MSHLGNKGNHGNLNNHNKYSTKVTTATTLSKVCGDIEQHKRRPSFRTRGFPSPNKSE